MINFKRSPLLTIIILILCISASYANEQNPKDYDTEFSSQENIAQYLISLEETCANINSYYAIMTKRIRIKKTLLEKQTLAIYFKKPFSIKIVSQNPEKDLEVVYVEGQNSGKMIVKTEALLGSHVRLKLDPESKLAMKNELHSIKEASIGKVIDLIVTNIKKGLAERKLTLEYNGEEEKYNCTMYTFTGLFNADEDDGYFCKKAIIKVDMELRLPREIIIYDWNDDIREWYEYLEFRINVPISDSIFDI